MSKRKASRLLIDDLETFLSECEAATKHLPGAGSGQGAEVLRLDAKDEATLDRIWDELRQQASSVPNMPEETEGVSQARSFGRQH